jgi:hypothetical protein
MPTQIDTEPKNEHRPEIARGTFSTTDIGQFQTNVAYAPGTLQDEQQLAERARKMAVEPIDDRTAAVARTPGATLGGRLVVALVLASAIFGWKFFGPRNALAEANWMTDWDRAVAHSKFTGKPALVLFRDDTSVACKDFEADVLGNREVVAHLTEHHTLVMVDTTDRNGLGAARARKYGVKEMPTLILYDRSYQESARQNALPAKALLAWLRSGGATTQPAPAEAQNE